MTQAQEKLREDIEKISDEAVIEKVRIFIMGIFAQQEIEKPNSQKDKIVWFQQ